MATVNGALAMGLNDADVLSEGKYADLILVDINKDSKDLIYDLVHNTSAKQVKLTMINGKILYQDGKYFIKDKVEDIYQKVEEISQRIEKDL